MLKTTALASSEIGADNVSESAWRGLLSVDFEGVFEGLDEGEHATAHFFDGAGEEELLLAMNEEKTERAPVQIGKKEESNVLEMRKRPRVNRKRSGIV